MCLVLKRSVLAATLLLLGASILRAQAAPPAVPGAPAAFPVAQFVDQTAFLVADINVASADIDAWHNWFMALMKQGGLPAKEQAAMEKESADGFAMIKNWQVKFTKAGGTHLFIILSGSDFPSALFVFPLAPGGDVAALKQVMSKDAGGLAWLLDDPAVYDTVGNMLIMGGADEVKRAKENAANPKRTPRPDLAAAFAAGGAAPHRLAFALPAQDKETLIKDMPKLPQEWGGGATAPVVNAFQYATATLTAPTAASPKFSVQVVVQAPDAAGAQKLKDVADAGVKILHQQAAHSGPAAAQQLIDLISPQVAGNKLTAEITQAQLEAASKSLVAFFSESRAQAKVIQSMANMREILLETIAYSGQNNGKLPTKFPDDIMKQLTAHRGDAAQKMILTNPSNGRYPGYVYVKPAEKIGQVKRAGETVMLYEAYDQWPQMGLCVGYVDGHCELIRDEAAFKKMLGNK